MNYQFCPKCNFQNAPEMGFCSNCGANLPNVSNFSPEPAPTVFSPAPSFTPPSNNNFQTPSVQAAPLSQTVESQKTGIGGKILSVLGTLFVGFILLLKFGVIFLRLGGLGGAWLLVAAVLIIIVFAVISLVKRLVK